MGSSPESSIADELRVQFRRTLGLDAEARAGALMDWILERLDATRCALVPFEAGIAGLPLALRVRGRSAPRELQRLPRRVVDDVARTRQPQSSADVEGEEASPSASLVQQRVRSYVAVPVLFRGDLLAIAYLDRTMHPRTFDADEQAAFAAFSYELARPLLDARYERHRREYEETGERLLRAKASRTGTIVPSPALGPVIERARRLAPDAEENLLLLGETGVGKEWLARLIHGLSGRRGPFVAVNVAAIPRELVDSELMGSTRGAFTGAVDRPGLAEQAEGGTLFLDEIADVELPVQVKLLRFLQDRRVLAVGSRSEREIDVRIIAATNRPVDALVRSGAVRADLLHRFAPPLRIPPLRERREEIVPLAADWLEARARRRGEDAPELTDSAKALLVRQPWPGNVRQLQAVVSHAAALSRDGRIDADDVAELLELAAPPDGPVEGAAPPSVPETWPAFCQRRDGLEAAWLRAALDAAGGKVQLAARRMGCPQTTLRNLLIRHGMLPGRTPRS